MENQTDNTAAESAHGMGSLADLATGVDLDALVHAALFNTDEWVVMKRGYFYRPRACGYTGNEDEAGVYTQAEAREHVRGGEEPVTMRRKTVPAYSTDHNAAALVLEKMRPDYHVNMTLYYQGQWRVQFSEPSREYIADGKTLPEAICRAALKAVSEQISADRP